MKLSLGSFATLGALASIAILALSGCTHRTDAGEWTIKAGTVVATNFEIDVTQVDEGAEDSTTYNHSYPACIVTAEQSDIVGVSRTESAGPGTNDTWLVWGKRAGNTVLHLSSCDGDNVVTINVTVTDP